MQVSEVQAMVNCGGEKEDESQGRGCVYDRGFASAKGVLTLLVSAQGCEILSFRLASLPSPRIRRRSLSLASLCGLKPGWKGKVSCASGSVADVYAQA